MIEFFIVLFIIWTYAMLYFGFLAGRRCERDLFYEKDSK